MLLPMVVVERGWNGPWRRTCRFKRLMDFKRRSQQFRYGVGIIDSIVAKYFATIVGFWVVSRPFLALADSSITADSSGLRGDSQSTLMEDYYTSGRMLLNMSSAVRARARKRERAWRGRESRMRDAALPGGRRLGDLFWLAGKCRG